MPETNVWMYYNDTNNTHISKTERRIAIDVIKLENGTLKLFYGTDPDEKGFCINPEIESKSIDVNTTLSNVQEVKLQCHIMSKWEKYKRCFVKIHFVRMKLEIELLKNPAVYHEGEKIEAILVVQSICIKENSHGSLSIPFLFPKNQSVLK
ncbi:unnamed protein product, partial [Mesorhabditis belari]|uniref:Uncharacterized protein n=1 Tax=Mesorhabditis belari TaxID=2138241 RepID=A0AAF3EEA9_9BILA